MVGRFLFGLHQKPYMKRPVLSAVSLIGILLFSAVFVQAYGGDGNVVVSSEPVPPSENSSDPVPPSNTSSEPVPTSGVCNDGEDNDNDTLTDRTDTGCTAIYRYDRSEYDMRDSDLTYELYGDKEIGLNEISVAIPGFVERSYGVRIEDCNPLQGSCVSSSSIGNGEAKVVEQSVNGLGYSQWAGGDLESVSVSSDGSVRIGEVDAESNGTSIINEPLSGSIFSDAAVETCGNGDRNMGEGKNTGCPQDWGLPDDLVTENGPRTAKKSGSDISEELGNFEANIGISNNYNLVQSDNPDYNMDFVGGEPSGERNIDITSLDLTEYGTVLYPHQGISGAPDFYAEGREIFKIYPYASEKTYASVSDTDLVLEGDIEKYTTSFSSERRYQTGCTDMVNYTCENNGRICTSVDSNQVRNYSLRQETKTVNIPTKRYEIKNTDGSGPWQNAGYQTNNTDLGLAINVVRNVQDGYSTHSVPKCDERTQLKICSQIPGTEGGTCNPVREWEFKYTPEEIEIGNMGSGEAYTSTKSESLDIKYESIQLKDSPVFSTDYGSNSRLPSDVNSTKALFKGDYPLEEISHDGFYYTVEPDYSRGDFSNSPAIATSSFDIMAQDGKFHSRRDYYGVFDADGTNGFGDSFIALEEGQVTQNTPAFDAETAIISPSGEKVGSDEGFLEASQNDFVDADDFLGPGDCPENFIYCVAAVDLDIKEWGDWSNPARPEFEFETIDKVHVNQSFGACRKYQELIGGARESILRCQYDYGENFPSGPVPFHKPNIVGGENS